MDAWVERELDGCEFPDGRLLGRCAKVLSALSQRIRHSVPGACQDWAATKAAYRFFANPRVDESMILARHFAATRARFSDSSGRVLVTRYNRMSTGRQKASSHADRRGL